MIEVGSISGPNFNSCLYLLHTNLGRCFFILVSKSLFLTWIYLSLDAWGSKNEHVVSKAVQKTLTSQVRINLVPLLIPSKMLGNAVWICFNCKYANNMLENVKNQCHEHIARDPTRP